MWFLGNQDFTLFIKDKWMTLGDSAVFIFLRSYFSTAAWSDGSGRDWRKVLVLRKFSLFHSTIITGMAWISGAWGIPASFQPIPSLEEGQLVSGTSDFIVHSWLIVGKTLPCGEWLCCPFSHVPPRVSHPLLRGTLNLINTSDGVSPAWAGHPNPSKTCQGKAWFLRTNVLLTVWENLQWAQLLSFNTVFVSFFFFFFFFFFLRQDLTS
jgi:hypothetical protein